MFFNIIKKIYITAKKTYSLFSFKVSNSLKYAFPGDRTGDITVELDSSNGGYTLIISDTGVGLPPDLDYTKVESSLGLKLVKSLVKQLNGTIELDESNGTRFTIKFREINYKKRI